MLRDNVLVVEDDESMLDFYRVLFESFHAKELSWVCTRSGAEALRVARRSPGAVGAAIVDWGLPDVDGLALVPRLRAVAGKPDLPVLMVSGRGDAVRRAEALEAGVDDFLTKPVEASELIARLRKVLARRRAAAAPAPGAVRGLRVDADTGAVVAGGRRRKLFPKELDLLLVFLRRPDRVLTPYFLWEAVWGYESDNRDNVIEVTISNLRRKLGPSWARRLETFRGKGYRLRLDARD